MKKTKTQIAGVELIQSNFFKDDRGDFVKVFQKSLAFENHSEVSISEIFFTQSKKNVIRGMHFQIPPKDHYKIVHVVDGQILDLVLDLRKNSPTFWQYQSFELSKGGHAILIPPGVAHGFGVLSDWATTAYAVTSEHDPHCDTGILFNSFGFQWPFSNPIVSTRDLKLKALKDFETPFL